MVLKFILRRNEIDMFSSRAKNKNEQVLSSTYMKRGLSGAGAPYTSILVDLD